MQTLVTIGEFSRLSHLTAKALRHYHDVGLLTPAQVDSTGYRRYGVDQVQEALLVRRLRSLEMPVPDIKAVLAADTESTRDAAIAQHLQRMEESLGRTSRVVASLRALLQPPDSPIGVEYRVVAPTSVVGIRAQVHRTDVADWLGMSYPILYAAIGSAGTDPAGPGGATYDAAFFEQDVGEVLTFVPVAHPVPEFSGDLGDQIEMTVLPPGRFVVAIHSGGYDEIDRSYGRLGSYVAEHDEPLPEPIREHYLVGPDRTPHPHDYRTEIWWPIRSHPTADRPAAARPAAARPAADRPVADRTPAAGAPMQKEN